MKVLEIFERELTSKDRRIEQLEDELLYFRKEQKESDLDRDKLKKENASLRKDLFELSKEYTNGK
jgi:predicted  nucleic acid-binding Zn-ribbon protein